MDSVIMVMKKVGIKNLCPLKTQKVGGAFYHVE